MNIFTHFPQASEQVTTFTESGSLDEAGIAAIFALMAMFAFVGVIVGLAGYLVASISLMQIFKKAGVPAWIAWVPFYNTWKMLEIGGQQGFWAVLAIIPVVNIVSAVMIYIAQFHIGLKLGKSGMFLLWAIFLPIVWLLWLAFDKSTWDESASPEAPSLHVPELAQTPSQSAHPESNVQQ